MLSCLGRICQEKKTHLYLLCRQTFGNIDLTSKIELKENDTGQEITAEKVGASGEDRERASATQGKKGGEIVLNTEQCRELNRVRARERR